jgi:alpha-tubulin suppressor-like RCC1 family protein
MKALRATLSAILLFMPLSLLAADLPQGYVVGWGVNALYGCDGVRSPDDSAGVVTMQGHALSNAVAITAGYGKFALLSDGTVFGWGNNVDGNAIGSSSKTEATNGLVRINGNILSNVVAISAGCLALKSDGTVVGWGLNSDANFIAGLSNIVAIQPDLALKGDGTLVSWGLSNGEKVVVPEGISNVVAIAQPGWASSSIALKKDGTVVEWHGHRREDQTPVRLSNVVAIAHAEAYNGAGHYLALKSDGTVFGWGINGYKGIATGSPTTNSPYTSSGIVTISGQVLTNVKAIAAGPFFSLVLKNDGTVVAWGDNGAHQTDVPGGLSNVVAIAAGDNYCLAITTNRAVAEKFRHK